MRLGCIGDDFTGSSDLANTLTKAGMRTTQYSGVPDRKADSGVDAGVIALKSRTVPSEDAVAQSLAALAWLQDQGCTQFLFKYCSTFDSTPEGNIGPVADALADALNARSVVICPAFPGTGRSVYQGHLFVNDSLLNESGMQNHPLTPMTDPDIRRWMAHQTPHEIAHIPSTSVFAGQEAIAAGLTAADAHGARYVVVDAIRDEDLIAIGAAARGLPLITGGSGIALGLPANFGCTPGDVHWKPQLGKAIVLSGSCSIATRGQVAQHKARYPHREVTVSDVLEGAISVAEAVDWVRHAGDLPLLYSSADPDVVAEVQETYGRNRSADVLETFFAAVAVGAHENGIGTIITAGGETSGAVVEGLGVAQLEIGPEIDPGVPAVRATPELVLALKSGNFGAPDFFEKAAHVLQGGT